MNDFSTVKRVQCLIALLCFNLSCLLATAAQPLQHVLATNDHGALVEVQKRRHSINGVPQFQLMITYHHINQDPLTVMGPIFKQEPHLITVHLGSNNNLWIVGAFGLAEDAGFLLNLDHHNRQLTPLQGLPLNARVNDWGEFEILLQQKSSLMTWGFSQDGELLFQTRVSPSLEIHLNQLLSTPPAPDPDPVYQPEDNEEDPVG